LEPHKDRDHYRVQYLKKKRDKSTVRKEKQILNHLFMGE
jgi:hypothetical protein